MTRDRLEGPDRVELLTELADLAWFEVDADRNVVAISPAMERLTGFAEADVLGRSCLRVHRCEECLKGCGVFDSGIVRDKHLELFRADGSLIGVSKSGRVFRDEQGRIQGAIEVVRPTAPASTSVDAPLDADELESLRLRRALESARYRRSEAARELGISRSTLWRKMKQHGL